MAWAETHNEQRKIQTTTREDIEAYLSKKKKSKLVEMLMAQFASGGSFRDQLLMEVASNAPGGIDVGSFFSAIDDAVFIEDFVSYEGMWEYTGRIEEVVETISDLLENGNADDVPLSSRNFALNASSQYAR